MNSSDLLTFASDMIEGLHRDDAGSYIAELEVSITSHCSLACANCGFNVPRQPEPAVGDDVIAELCAGLHHLERLGVEVRSLAVLGGEPTLYARLLERAVVEFRGVPNIGRIEVVSNGLTPRGCSEKALQHIDRLSISVYVEDEAFSRSWRAWLGQVAPHVELVFRGQTEGWAPWVGDAEVDATEALKMFESCWYRKHCVTLERGRIFVCSRIPKAAQDAEGLRLDATTSLTELEGYLNGRQALPSCAHCIPMMGLPNVPAGIQPDARLVQLSRAAIGWLATAAGARAPSRGSSP